MNTNTSWGQLDNRVSSHTVVYRAAVGRLFSSSANISKPVSWLSLGPGLPWVKHAKRLILVLRSLSSNWQLLVILCKADIVWLATQAQT